MGEPQLKDLRFLDVDGNPVDVSVIYRAISDHLKVLSDNDSRISPNHVAVQLLANTFATEFAGQDISGVLVNLMHKKQRTDEDKQRIALCIRLINAGVERF
ncbi:MAG: hypothetical protein LC650_01165 [Actinobacteria bacterium]|nr:hypothetical protein [Actinomycetota bacterium]